MTSSSSGIGPVEAIYTNLGLPLAQDKTIRENAASLVGILLGDRTRGIAPRWHEVPAPVLASFLRYAEAEPGLDRTQINILVTQVRTATSTSAGQSRDPASGPANYLHAITAAITDEMNVTQLPRELIQLTESYAERDINLSQFIAKRSLNINDFIRDVHGRLERFTPASLAALKILGRYTTALDLSDIIIQPGMLRRLAEYFPNATTIDLTNCHLNDAALAELVDFKNLEKCMLCNNHELTDVRPLKNCTALRTLDIGGCCFAGILQYGTPHWTASPILTHVHELTQLTDLNIDHLSYGSERPEIRANIEALEGAGMRITGQGPHGIMGPSEVDAEGNVRPGERGPRGPRGIAGPPGAAAGSAT